MKFVKNWYENLPSNQRTNVIRGSIGAGFIVFALLAYSATQNNKEDVIAEEKPVTSIMLGDQLIEDDLRKRVELDRKTQAEANIIINKQLQEVNTTIADLNKIIADQKNDKNISTQQPLQAVENQFAYPPPPPLNNVTQHETMQIEAEAVHIGGIAIAEGKETKSKDPAKKNTGVYLSPGFMEGMLLTGLKAETVKNAKDNPEPMIIRIQAPAVLPNYVKANLKGCFVIAHGFGKLNKERIEARLVGLHCLNQDEEAVVDEKIKGFIVDADGTKGMAGRVVTKAGANTARMFIAGIISGFGEGISAANTSTVINPIGAIAITPSIEEAMKQGVGKGITKASDQLSEVFLELVKQSSPIIEVGPAKKITLALTEGVYLHIKNLNEYKRRAIK